MGNWISSLRLKEAEKYGKSTPLCINQEKRLRARYLVQQPKFIHEKPAFSVIPILS